MHQTRQDVASCARRAGGRAVHKMTNVERHETLRGETWYLDRI